MIRVSRLFSPITRCVGKTRHQFLTRRAMNPDVRSLELLYVCNKHNACGILHGHAMLSGSCSHWHKSGSTEGGEVKRYDVEAFRGVVAILRGDTQ